MHCNLQNALWLLSLSSPDTWDRVTKAGGCDTRAAGSRSFTAIYISLVSLLGLYRVGFLTQRSKGRSDNPDVDNLEIVCTSSNPIHKYIHESKVRKDHFKLRRGLQRNPFHRNFLSSHKQTRSAPWSSQRRLFFGTLFFVLFLVTTFIGMLCLFGMPTMNWLVITSYSACIHTLNQTLNLSKKNPRPHFFSQTNYATKCVLSL